MLGCIPHLFVSLRVSRRPIFLIPAWVPVQSSPSGVSSVCPVEFAWVGCPRAACYLHVTLSVCVSVCVCASGVSSIPSLLVGVVAYHPYFSRDFMGVRSSSSVSSSGVIITDNSTTDKNEYLVLPSPILFMLFFFPSQMRFSSSVRNPDFYSPSCSFFFFVNREVNY
jgi:hypothetical protein